MKKYTLHEFLSTPLKEHLTFFYSLKGHENAFIFSADTNLSKFKLFYHGKHMAKQIIHVRFITLEDWKYNKCHTDYDVNGIAGFSLRSHWNKLYDTINSDENNFTTHFFTLFALGMTLHCQNNKILFLRYNILHVPVSKNFSDTISLRIFFNEISNFIAYETITVHLFFKLLFLFVRKFWYAFRTQRNRAVYTGSQWSFDWNCALKISSSHAIATKVWLQYRN